MQRLAGVFLEVDTTDAHAARLAAALELDHAGRRDRQLVLRDLIALRQVRIEVVLAREDGCPVNRAAESQRRANRVVDRGTIQHRQRAGQPEADGTDVCVRLPAEGGTASAEDFRRGEKLCVDLEPDNRFKQHSW